MDVAVQFVVDVVIADVLQGSAASGAFEALHVEVLLLDPDEHSPTEKVGRLNSLVSDFAQV